MRTRRLALVALPVTALLAATAVVVAFATPAATAPKRARPAATRQVDRPLRTLAERHDLRIGTAIDDAALETDTAYRDLAAREFSAVTPENAMKWSVLEPVRGQFHWEAADKLVAFANQNHQKVRGHTLVWHSQLPAWLTDGVTAGTITPTELSDLVREHITTVMTHFKGKIWQWDVVNESIADGDNPGLRDSIFSRYLGPGYIADALRWARAADPKAKLWINDYGTDRINTKSDGYYAMIKQLVADGAPLDGVGFQGHVAMTSGFPITAIDNLRRFNDLGLSTGFTEIDVRYQLPGDSHKTAAQVGAYTTLLTACLMTPHCELFTVWGFSDKYSWIPATYPGEGEATPMDANLQPKPVYRALQQTLALAG